ncbi:hypothetical protein HME9302_01496 [Alteripontixanthobacter maritimus]|uniref:Uncharacterized protein n=1 Tax=Alteripontixanthobacter maritimus TaxID=2161824 RepID=A0A369Q9R4_9SPHN|nr:hypothetical protein [Alteripontixanthobacter maritimus]RDC60295.1 hypothetical protein HME9302_01496 [Alteripontixanthobacter maritimus]
MISATIAQMRIQRDLTDAEAALAEALVKQTSLLATLLTARRDVSTKPFQGHLEIVRLLKSQQALLDAEGNLLRVHGGLKKIQGDVLGYVECPENEPMKEIKTG